MFEEFLVGEDEVRGLFADEELLEHNALARAAKDAIDHCVPNGGFGCRPMLSDYDTFSGGETVGLHHQWITEPAGGDERERVVG